MRFIPLYLLIIFITYSCSFIDREKRTINDLIPINSSLIIRIDSPNKFKSDIINNSVSLKILDQEKTFDFKKQIEIIEKLPENNPILICLNNQKENKSFTIISKQANKELDFKNQKIYNKIIDSIYVISNSLNQIEKVELRNNNLYEKLVENEVNIYQWISAPVKRACNKRRTNNLYIKVDTPYDIPYEYLQLEVLSGNKKTSKTYTNGIIKGNNQENNFSYKSIRLQRHLIN